MAIPLARNVRMKLLLTIFHITMKAIFSKLYHFYSTISDKLKSERSTSQDNSDYDFGKLQEYVSQKMSGDTQLKIPLMKHSDLVNAIETLKSKKSTGIDGITPKILKALAKIVCPSLLKNMNISLYSDQFPDALKITNIIQINSQGWPETRPLKLYM